MEITLNEYLKNSTQADLAKALGITPGAVYQWVKHDRDIRVIKHKDGSVTAYQVKPIGRAS